MTNDVFHRMILEASDDNSFTILPFNDHADNLYNKRTMLIKNQDQDSDIKYIGGVMFCYGNDLHVYMLPEFRKKGIMKWFMQSIVIPHIFYELKWKEICVSCRSKEGEVLLKSLGFVQDGDEWWVLEK